MQHIFTFVVDIAIYSFYCTIIITYPSIHNKKISFPKLHSEKLAYKHKPGTSQLVTSCLCQMVNKKWSDPFCKMDGHHWPGVSEPCQRNDDKKNLESSNLLLLQIKGPKMKSVKLIVLLVSVCLVVVCMLNAVHAADDLVVDENGNIGIGTTTPASKLDVIGAIRAGNSDIYLTKTDHNHTGIGNTSGYAAIENAANYDALMILGRAGTSKGRYVRLWDYLQVNGGMDITGKVGIGTTTPQWPLEVLGSEFAAPAIRGNSSGYSGKGVQGLSSGTYGNGLQGVATGYHSTGVLGSGTASDFYAGGPGVNYAAASSKRYKKNITKMKDILDKVMSIRGVTFDWDQGHGGKRDFGFIAEEIGQYFPEIVVYEKDGVNAIAMDYGAMTPVLAEAIQELKIQKDAEIDELRSQIEDLKHENKTLKSNIEDIYARIKRLEKK